MPNSVESLKVLRGNPDPDAKVLWNLVRNGSDLSKPHEPDFWFDTETLGFANALAAELDGLGYDVEVYEPDADNPKYAVRARRLMVLELKELNGLTEQFEALASKHNAIYDGWGAEVVE